MKLPSRLADVATLARTLAHLRPSQIAWRGVHVARRQAERRVAALARVRPDPTARAAELPAFALSAIDVRPAELWRQGVVAYHGIRAARDDWRGEGRSKLWRYERQYHSEVVALAATNPDLARALVDDWLAQNPPGRGEAWEPYPVARRLLNWCLAAAIAPALRDAWAPWLAAQMGLLAGRLERHLLGNHLLCDLCAIVAAAASLRTADSGTHSERAARRLERELDRQVLPDGGYAERTVQYHAWVLHDTLLALALQRARGRELAVAPLLERMGRWLAAVRRADGSYPWLNDAAPAGLPSAELLSDLARAAGVAAASGARPPILELPDTGWTLLREGGHELLFEHGIVGPRHQPGHGHADALSFELVWDGLPLVCDTGVTTYEVGEVRRFERSAAAHATVEVDGHGADETWASFRVGGRSRPIYLGKSSPWPGAWLLRGQATAYQGWLHRRGLLFWPGRGLVVADRVERTYDGASIRSMLPLGPEWDVAGSTLVAGEHRLEVAVLQGSLGEPDRGDYPGRPGWVGSGFGQGRGRFSLALAADGDGRVLYALLAPGVRLTQAADGLTIASDEGHQRIALAALLP
jgi:hypothetical protein